MDKTLRYTHVATGSCSRWKCEDKHRRYARKIGHLLSKWNTLRKPLPYLSGQIECIFLNWESATHARLGAASCFVFSSNPQAPFKELQSLLIERVPLSGPGNSNNNSRPSLAGRRPLTTRAGAGGERWEVSQKRGSLRLYILGRLACVAQTAP